MNKRNSGDLGIVIVATLAFAFIFALVHMGLARLGQDVLSWEFIIDALIAALALLYIPRSEE